jgi:hypothetical protein
MIAASRSGGRRKTILREFVSNQIMDIMRVFWLMNDMKRLQSIQVGTPGEIVAVARFTTTGSRDQCHQ